RGRKYVSIKGKAYIVGAFEHPDRVIPDRSVAQIHAENTAGVLADAGLKLSDIDGFFVVGGAGGMLPVGMADYLGLTNLRYMDGTAVGGSSPVYHIGHAAAAIAQGKCNVVLITLANRPRSEAGGRGMTPSPETAFELVYGTSTLGMYALAAQRHMYEYGTTSEQLAWVKAVASEHAQYNEHALLRKVVSVDEVLASPMLSDPLHRLDSCVVTDGGGAVIVASPEVAARINRPRVK